MKLLSSRPVKELHPGPNNPRNSEGAFLRLDNNRLTFVFSRYEGFSAQDHAPCNLCAIYSDDNGEHWSSSPEVLVRASDYGEENVMSVSLARMENGDIGLFFLLKHLGTATQYLLRRYQGDFRTFLGETKCFPNQYEGYFVVNNDRVLHRNNGTWMVSAAYHQSNLSATKENGYGYLDYRASVYTFLSEDDGRTWKQNYGILHLNDPYSRTGLQEPGLLELSNGILYCYARTDRAWQYESVSLDGGNHWFAPQPSRFSSPESPMLLKKNPYNGKFYALYNPVAKGNLDNPSNRGTGGRTPFALAESDDGLSFSPPLLLEEEKNRGFCYPALYFLSETEFLLAYCNGDESGCLNSTLIRKITIG